MKNLVEPIKSKKDIQDLKSKQAQAQAQASEQAQEAENAVEAKDKEIEDLKAQLEKANGKILGVVLNKVNYSEQHYYYGKGYGKYGKYAHYSYGYRSKYGYGSYGYGYGSYTQSHYGNPNDTSVKQ